MGYFFNTSKDSGKTTPEQQRLQAILESNPKLKKKVEKAGKPKISILNRLFGALNWGETAPIVSELQKGKSLGEALQTQALSSGKRLLGQAPEVPQYEDVLETAGWKEDAFGTKAAGLGLDILLDVGNVVNPFKPAAKLAGKVAGAAVDVGAKLPVVGDVVKSGKKVVNVLEDLFVPAKKFERIGPKGTEFLGDLGKFQKGTRYAQRKAAEEGFELSKKAQGISKTANEQLLEFLEPSGKTVEDVGDVGKTIKGWFKDIAGKEKARGLLDKEIPDYLYHATTKEAREAGVEPMVELAKHIKAIKGSHRNLGNFIKEANKKSLAENGFKIFEEDVLKAATLRNVNSIGKVRAYDFLKQVENKFGVAGNEAKLVDGVRNVPFMPEIPGAKKFLLPEPIAKELKNINKILINDEAVHDILKTYDKVLGIWKGSVTGWFPAFHGRNAMGGIFNNWIAGVTNPARYADGEKFARGVDEVVSGVKIGGEEVTYKGVNELAGKLGATGDQGFFDVMKNMEDLTASKFTKGIGKTGEVPRKTMNFIEDRLRGTLIIDRLKKGDTMEEAVKQVWKFHFDYAPEALTGFETGVMKRLIPFYTWTSNNIPLQLEQMIKQPAKYAAVGKTLRTFGGGEEEKYLPDYMKRTQSIKIGEKEGLSQYLYGIGLPVDDVNKLNKADILSMLSPIIKTPAELLTNKHFFFDKPLDEVNSPPKGFQVNAPKIIKDLVDYNEGTKKVNPTKWHLLSSLVGRFLWTGAKIGDPDTSLELKALYGALGIKGKGVDIEQEKEWRGREAEDEISKLLFQKGYAKKYQNYYIPKEK